MKKAITVSSGDEVFGFFIHDVKEVVKCPRIFPLPKAPGYVKGIATLRGDCLPIISLSRLLWNRDEEGQKVLIGQINGETIGFLVAEVNKVIEVSDEDLKRPSSALGKDIKKKYVSAVYSDNGKLITFLQMKKLVDTSTSKKQEEKAIRGSSKQKVSSGVQQDIDQGESVLIFEAGGDVYGIAVSEVREIVEYPERVVPAPSAPYHVLGLFSIRGKVIPLISIKRFLGSEAESARGRVIIIQRAGVEVGLEADSAREIRRVREEEVVPPPSSLDQQQEKILKGIIKLDGGKRLVHFLDPAPFIELEGMVSNEKGMEEEMKIQEQRKMFVWFSLASEAMALPIEVVKEAVNVDRIVPVPRAPEFVEGVMNLRGEVLPIISLANLLGSEVEQNEGKKVIVAHLNGAEVGLLVKEIKGILRVSEADVSPLSEVAREAAQAFSGAIRRDDDLILVLDMEALLSGTDKEELQALTVDEGEDRGNEKKEDQSSGS